MKKLILGIGAILIAAAGYAQKDLISSVFEKYAGVEGITTVNISGDMLNMMAKAEMEKRDTIIQSKLSGIRVLAVEGECEKPVQLDLRTEVYDKLDKSVYKEMVTVKKTDEDVVVLLKESDGRISEMLVIVGGPRDNALIQIKGDMLLSELSEMMGNFPMKGFDQLKKMD